ncbi:MAG: hypothetical protein ACT4PT_08865 [Methanobacteriota archaeon]
MTMPRPLLLAFLLLPALLSGCLGNESASDEDLAALRADVSRLEAENARMTTELASGSAENARLETELASAVPDAGGLLWAFSPYQIAVYNPLVSEPVHRIPVDNLSFGDAVVTADGSKVLVNEQTKSEVLVIDTASRAIVKNVPVGQRPVHIYNPRFGNEVWTHADGDGTFYVIDTASLNVTHRVPASANATGPTGHGKLLWAPELGNKAYATNTGDAAVHVIDLAAHRATGTIPTCQGTHGTSYARRTGFAFFACGGPQKVSVVDTRTDSFVKDLTGGGQVWPGAHEPIMFHNETRMLSSHRNGTTIIDVATNEVVGLVNLTGFGHMEFHHTADGKVYAFTPANDLPIVHVIDVAAGTVARSIYTGFLEPAHAAGQHGTSILATERYVIVARETDGVISVIEMETLEPVNLFVDAPRVTTIAFVAG